MKLSALLLVFLVRMCSCKTVSSQTSKLYFHLLQSSAEDYVPERDANMGHRRTVSSDNAPLVTSQTSKLYLHLLQSSAEDYVPERDANMGQRRTVSSDNAPLVTSQTSKMYLHLLQSSTEDYVPERDANMGQRRTVSSDNAPLVNPADEIRNPKPSEINITQLQQQLGKEFDQQFMSIEEPEMPADNPNIQFINGRPKGPRPEFFSLLWSPRLQDGTDIHLNVAKSVRRKVQKFMWNYTFCPVKYSWKFLGSHVWPQWVKEGSCYSERSCSIPAGMTCKQKTHTNKTFLMWHCNDFHRRHHCRWIEFKYPILTECSCSC